MNGIHKSRYGLVRNEIGRDTINFEDFRELENSILRDPDVTPIEDGPVARYSFSALFRLLRRVGRTMGWQPPYDIPPRAKFQWRIAILGGIAFRRCPNFIMRGNKAAYLFDPSLPWNTIEQIKQFVEDTGISA